MHFELTGMNEFVTEINRASLTPKQGEPRAELPSAARSAQNSGLGPGRREQTRLQPLNRANEGTVGSQNRGLLLRLRSFPIHIVSF